MRRCRWETHALYGVLCVCRIDPALLTSRSSSPPLLPSPLLVMSFGMISDSDHYAGSRRDTRDALNRELRNDQGYQQALREMEAIEQAELASGGRIRCESCGATGLLPSLLDDHAVVCPNGLCECPLSCGASPMPRSQLWTHHLRGECRRYVILCSSFRCKRNNEPPQPGALEVASQASASSSSSAAASRPPRDLLPLRHHSSMDCSGCNVIRGGPNSPHLHYPTDRAEYEAGQRFLSDIGLPEAQRNPAGAHLRVCPCCSQRMVVANAPDVGAADELDLMDATPPFGLPYHDRTYDSAEIRSSYWYRAADAPKNQRATYTHQTRALAISQAAADLHVQRCTTRRAEAKAASAAAEAATAAADSSSSSSSSSSSLPLAFSSDDCGILKFQPRFADCCLGVIPADATAAMQPQQTQASGAAVSNTAPSAPYSTARTRGSGVAEALARQPSAFAELNDAAVAAGGVRFVLSWSAVLTQSLLLRVGLDSSLKAPSRSSSVRSSSSSSSSAPVPSAVALVAEQLFVHGANLSDLLVMYDKRGEMHRTLRPMSTMQKRSIDPAALSDALSPLQRPLVLPLLTPHLIPDLAKMVLHYF